MTSPTDDSVDRPIKDIVFTVMKLVDRARAEKRWQVARDLEKLCGAAMMVDPERLK